MMRKPNTIMVLTDGSDSVWRWVFRVAITGIPVVLILGRTAVVIAGSLAIVILGMLAIGRLGDMAKTPFSFCLPGFRESLRRWYFSTAAVMGLGTCVFGLGQALLFSRREGLAGAGDSIYAYLQAVSGFLVGLAIGLIVGTPRLVLSKAAWGILTLLSIPLFLVAVVTVPAFVEYPLIGIPVCTALCGFVWFRLGNLACVKRGHRRIIAYAAEQERETATESWTHSGDVVTVPLWAESLFCGWMQSRPYLSAGRYIWGALYEAFGLWFSYWESILFAVAAAALVLGLLGGQVAPTIALICLVFADRAVRLPVTSTLLLPGGRREKCYAIFATALAASLLLLGAAVVVVVLARVGVLLVSGAFPDGADGPADRTTSLAGLFLPCVLVPTILSMHVMREDGRGIAWVPGTLLFASVTLLAFWRSTWPEELRLWFLAAIFVFGWVFFLVTLWAAYRRWDLA